MKRNNYDIYSHFPITFKNHSFQPTNTPATTKKFNPCFLSLLQVSVKAEADAKALALAEAKPDATLNKAGAPVYYPPGHELFHETMHVSIISLCFHKVLDSLSLSLFFSLML